VTAATGAIIGSKAWRRGRSAAGTSAFQYSGNVEKSHGKRAHPDADLSERLADDRRRLADDRPRLADDRPRLAQDRPLPRTIVPSFRKMVRALPTTVGALRKTVRALPTTVGALRKTVRALRTTVPSSRKIVRALPTTVQSLRTILKTVRTLLKTAESRPDCCRRSLTGMRENKYKRTVQ
jgi:hypothetical protein